MIYTVTFNPSLDYIVTVEDFKLGFTNRTSTEWMLPGGKGINVSIVLKNMGFDSVALGFTAGFVGDEIQRRLEEMGVRTNFIQIPNGNSRINVKLQSMEGTEINGCGPSISEEEAECLIGQLRGMEPGDVLFLAGSIPPSMPDDMYRRIMERLKDRQVTTVVDATGRLLRNVLEYRPFLIKPNIQELEELFQIKVQSREEIIRYAEKLQQEGARNVLVSMAGDGALLLAENGGVWSAKAPEGKLVNGVGAGDSMVAGFMAGWLEKQDYGHAFAMGVAAGSASAFSEYLATREDVMKLYRQQERAERNV
ncbi:MAG: 1-phosphofructokinase [Roseburia sp.]|nr:1-phosphofructokinase [Roseburia sp.]